KVLAIQLDIIDAYYGTLGPYIHLTTSGDDFGTQRGPLVSPAMFAEFVVPYFAERIARTKKLGNYYFWHHSCGSIYKLLPQIIACGVDILNPIQTSAADMTPEQLKAGFGKDLVFWGAMDVQQFLRQSSPAEVEREVVGLIDNLGADGGFVMAPAHEIQDDIPPENIAAWISTLNR
ncbi:methyltransferase, partial [bacterium]|nr:methyltransferase [bacterium]